jgi:hypothetical protein
MNALQVRALHGVRRLWARPGTVGKSIPADFAPEPVPMSSGPVRHMPEEKDSKALAARQPALQPVQLAEGSAL